MHVRKKKKWFIELFLVTGKKKGGGERFHRVEKSSVAVCTKMHAFWLESSFRVTNSKKPLAPKPLENGHKVTEGELGQCLISSSFSMCQAGFHTQWAILRAFTLLIKFSLNSPDQVQLGQSQWTERAEWSDWEKASPRGELSLLLSEDLQNNWSSVSNLHVQHNGVGFSPVVCISFNLRRICAENGGGPEEPPTLTPTPSTKDVKIMETLQKHSQKWLVQSAPLPQTRVELHHWHMFLSIPWFWNPCGQERLSQPPPFRPPVGFPPLQKGRTSLLRVILGCYSSHILILGLGPSSNQHSASAPETNCNLLPGHLHLPGQV